MKTIFDTNVIFAYLTESDPYHEKAKKLILNANEIVIPFVVLLELTYLFIKYKVDIKLIEELLISEEVEYVENKLEDVFFALKNNPKSYDELNDYIILHTSLRTNSNLETFDKGLKRLYSKYRK